MNPIKTNSSLISVRNTRLEDSESIHEIIALAFGGQVGEPLAMSRPHVQQQLRRFPEGQFVAVYEGRVVGTATTMRTHKPPTAMPLPWLKMIGGLELTNHDSNGQWLYGAEFAVHPSFQGMGLGRRLYDARFEFVRRLNLRGFYAVGMLMGYHRYKHLMSTAEYAQKVVNHEIDDPTVSMQMKRGFKPMRLVEGYNDEPHAGDAGMLIVWHNPDYRPMY
ncbi:MAG: GNAT family N-acetyltransferase [Chloroflexi bacterium]|nr:GNAT family N-acetyltransferase [Chloroflexota bacterium]